jgi:hypothetical protein
VLLRKGTLGLGPDIALSVLDVSETGVRMLLKVALARGQEVEIVLQPAGYPRDVKLTGHIVWCIPTADGSHGVGIQFDKRMDYTAYQSIGRSSVG